MGEQKEIFIVTDEALEMVLNLDCRKDISVRRLKKSLNKLPFIKSESDVQTDRMEEIIKKLEMKHAIHLAYVMRSVVDMQDICTGMIKSSAGSDNGKWLRTVYGQTFWEVTAKTLFFMYYYINKNKKKSKIVK